MLPTWATLVLTFGASGITGLVAILSVWLRGRIDRRLNEERWAQESRQLEQRLAHDREEQWRDRLIKAADDFSTGISQALLGVHDAIAAVPNRGDREATLAEAERAIGEAIARAGRIRLLFGEESPVAKIVNHLLPQLSHALSFVKPKGAEVHSAVPDAWKALERAYEQHREFNASAFQMISKPRWAVGRSLEMKYRIEGNIPRDDERRTPE